MLIRVSGGKGGIKEYLEEGIKNGRDYSRNELDERVILSGDLELVNDVIKTMEGDAQRYLHITLSFKEDHIDEATLNAVTQDFKAFAMKAYQDDEYAFYAEAHLPKIKTYLDQATGESVERKPHIHVVIPQKNLLTGKRLEPFGLVEKNEHYIDAFQEATNEKYQLASPKHHVRSTFTNESTIISRHKADLFPAQQRNVKSKALEVLLSDDITTTTAFAQKLEASGFDVKIRNQGKDNEYLNIKSPEQKRGVNLKDNVFQPQFVALPKAEKMKLLDNQYNPYRENGDSPYRATKKHHNDLQHWNTTRAYELKFINFGNRAKYKALTPEQKQQFLTDKRTEYGQSRISATSFDDINQSIRAASQHLLNAQRNRGQFESGVRNVTHRRAIRAAFANLERHSGDQSPPIIQRNTSERLNQCLYALETRVLPDVKHIKQNIDALALLHRLSTTHGVDVDKYAITKGKDGGDRIQCGNRYLNVSDFLTKEMHLSWKDAKQYLEDRYLAQQGIDPRQAVKEKPELNLIQAAWRTQLQSEREQRQTYLAHYRLEKTAIYSDKTLSKEERNIALSIAQMNKVIHDLQFKRENREAREQLVYHAQKTNKEDRPMREEIGIVVSHKEAPYKHNKKNELSYVVEIENHGRIREVWGKDLKRVMEENQVQQGDKIKLTQSGQKNVTVTARQEQADGSIKHEPLNTKRNEWHVSIATDAEIKQHAETIQTAPESTTTPSVKSQVNESYINTKVNQSSNDKTLSPNTTQFYDKNLEASRLLIQYPKLKELGINVESITKTEKGDKIQYGEKSLTVTQLMKETNNLKPKEIISELKPLYDIQVKDNERIIKFKNNYMNNDRKSLSELEHETRKTSKRQQGTEQTLSPSHEPEKERKVLTPEPNNFGEHITHETNKKGHVTYYQGDEKLVTDRGNNILIEQQSNKAVEIGLRLAIEKYGHHLDIKGTKEYQSQIIDIAVTNKLNISFKNKALNEQLIARKAQFEKGENLITKAENAYKAQSKQAEKGQQQAKEQPANQQQRPTKGWER
ncbi:relaxase [Vibrio parahaemolyticus]|uniref:LPD7 domain-containing protein n=4 Tax=Vibrio parahaemolyticus TaxID=670 RepID=UPI00061B2BA1|nr:LPD7 domain-containing protein [Vibrio parahaemolyticus]ELN6894076.1 relaxase [Vibrio cholerae]EIK4811122.1 relaxase [Vibrio parahaemolyticus]KKC79457.1 relaxase [Vibrio parahaemolyticus]KKX76955.1 relaxase [Vibrio parahaemolyticus]KYZ05214.1 relaxase [Vibrio parahaemolyticus]